MKSILPCFLIMLITACSQTPTTVAQSVGACGEEFSPTTGLQFSAAQQAFESQQYFSALALLQEIKGGYITKDSLEADAYLKTQQWDKAQQIYIMLLTTCLKGKAAHGLGLIASYKSQYPEAYQWLSLAVSIEPSQSNIRNDYGFILLLTGNNDEARNEFLTALELNPRNQVAAKNLWMLLHRTERQQAASSLQQRFSWSEQEHQKLANAANNFTPLSIAEMEKWKRR